MRPEFLPRLKVSSLALIDTGPFLVSIVTEANQSPLDDARVVEPDIATPAFSPLARMVK
jgi:hypothetical protein